MNILRGLTILLLCQLVGDVTVTFFQLPVPGPVIGMVLLLLCLLWSGKVPPSLEVVGKTILSHLSLLFIPSGVGVVLIIPLLVQEWLPLSIALVASTLLAIVVTGMVVQWLLYRSIGKTIDGE